MILFFSAVFSNSGFDSTLAAFIIVVIMTPVKYVFRVILECPCCYSSGYVSETATAEGLVMNKVKGAFEFMGSMQMFQVSLAILLNSCNVMKWCIRQL